MRPAKPAGYLLIPVRENAAGPEAIAGSGILSFEPNIWQGH